jgi:hypothetical protein
VSWLDRILGRKDRESAGGVGAWASDEEHRANKQRADTGALEVEGDPRGGLQDAAYRTADPREIVESEGVAMTGPGGAPQEGTTPEERREDQREGAEP